MPLLNAERFTVSKTDIKSSLGLLRVGGVQRQKHSDAFMTQWSVEVKRGVGSSVWADVQRRGQTCSYDKAGSRVVAGEKRLAKGLGGCIPLGGRNQKLMSPSSGVMCKEAWCHRPFRNHSSARVSAPLSRLPLR